MDIQLEAVEELRFPDGSPVRAASAVAPLGDGFVVVQDDATHGAWYRGGTARAVRLLPPVAGLDQFEEASGTKHLKPDLEAACLLPGGDALLMLGSGSSPARMRWSWLRLVDGEPVVEVAEMAQAYGAAASALGVPPDVLNMEGACVVGDAVRWFHRGMPSAGFPSGSVDLDPATGAVSGPRTYDLGEVDGVGLAMTDAVALSDGAILVSAAAEDSPNPRDDGPVVGSALVRIESDVVVDAAPLPTVRGSVAKVEGLMLLDTSEAAVRLLAVVDVDDPAVPSLALTLGVSA
ncbi:hypothetical protein HNR19_001099 [Nocardioides thalensis]|uniref:Uncharacterized protein n=1 Tax=Nocardioides thalensis TaxID=1914755 RepID=A0A853BZM1_9ACTN|nr:hypothetical protein [Nocardioides thalensis]NYJ00401.1 hypothetical protein [Nocardioides thalensis]